MTDIADKFVIESIYVSNYYNNNNDKLSGKVKIKNRGTETSIEMPMTKEDAADILMVFADRISAHMGIVARAVMEDIKPQSVIAAPVEEVDAEDVSATTVNIDDDGIPF